MATQAVEVNSVIVGGAREGPKLRPVVLQLASERLTVRELIERTVKRQIEELTTSRRLEADQARLALHRQYLTAAEVAGQSELGRVAMPKRQRRSEPRVDVAAETERALAGFEGRAFRVVVDGRTAEGLDDVLVLRPSTKVTFLRLIPLAGG